MKQLHHVQNKVKSTIRLVEASMGLTNCVNGIEKALEKENYEKATELISNIINLEDIFKNQHVGLLKNSEINLKNKIMNEFKKHLQAENIPEVTRFFQFMIQLGMDRDGTIIYVNHLYAQFQKELADILDLPWMEKFTSYLDLVIHFFEDKSIPGMNWIGEWIQLVDPFIVKELKEFEVSTLKGHSLSLQVKLEDLLHLTNIYYTYVNYLNKIKQMNGLDSNLIMLGFSSYYYTFESQLLKENFGKAIQMNEKYQPNDEEEEEEEIKCDSVIHDVFYFIKSSLDRSISAIHPNFVRENLKLVTSFTLQELKEYILSNEDEMEVMNNLDALYSYMSKHPKSSEFASALVTLKEQLSIKVSSFFATTLQREVQVWLEEFKKISYDLDENGFLVYERKDPLQIWLNQLDTKMLKRLKKELSRNVFDLLLNDCVTFFLMKMESILFQKRFTQFGGLFFDKQLRSMIFYFSERSSKTIRDKFMRMNHISSLLKLFKLSEAMELWNDHTISWKLTFVEIKKVLELRVDFGRESIAKLKF